MFSYALLFVPYRFYELYRALLLQIETGASRLTWWESLLIIGLVILVLVLALAWNASKTAIPDLEHPIIETHEALEPPSDRGSETQTDDLTRIEGIGPKIATLLQENGITTFGGLAAADLGTIEFLLEEAGLQFIDATTWSEQAALAAKADENELTALQERLKGGRRQ